jgi:hypothetical protein
VSRHPGAADVTFLKLDAFNVHAFGAGMAFAAVALCAGTLFRHIAFGTAVNGSDYALSLLVLFLLVAGWMGCIALGRARRAFRKGSKKRGHTCTPITWCKRCQYGSPCSALACSKQAGQNRNRSLRFTPILKMVELLGGSRQCSNQPRASIRSRSSTQHGLGIAHQSTAQPTRKSV